MPTYVYRCKQCGHRFEAWQHMTDDPLTVCPQCQGPINRVVFANGIVFHGSGFYSTDSRPTKVATESASASTEAPAKTDSTGESSSSTAPTSTAPSTGASSTGTEAKAPTVATGAQS